MLWRTEYWSQICQVRPVKSGDFISESQISRQRFHLANSEFGNGSWNYIWTDSENAQTHTILFYFRSIFYSSIDILWIGVLFVYGPNLAKRNAYKSKILIYAYHTLTNIMACLCSRSNARFDSQRSPVVELNTYRPKTRIFTDRFKIFITSPQI